MAGRRPSIDHVEYSLAVAKLTKYLEELGVENPMHPAEQFMRDLVLDGWRHTRPKLDLEPPKGEPASQEFKAQVVADLRAELAQVEPPPVVEEDPA